LFCCACSFLISKHREKEIHQQADGTKEIMQTNCEAHAVAQLKWIETRELYESSMARKRVWVTDLTMSSEEFVQLVKQQSKQNIKNSFVIIWNPNIDLQTFALPLDPSSSTNSSCFKWFWMKFDAIQICSGNIVTVFDTCNQFVEAFDMQAELEKLHPDGNFAFVCSGNCNFIEKLHWASFISSFKSSVNINFTFNVPISSTLGGCFHWERRKQKPSNEKLFSLKFDI